MNDKTLPAIPPVDAGQELTLPAEPWAEKAQSLLAASKSDNTRRAYRCAVEHFTQWGGALPASVEQVCQYLVETGELYSSRTLSLRLTALGEWHRLSGVLDPTRAPVVAYSR